MGVLDTREAQGRLEVGVEVGCDPHAPAVRAWAHRCRAGSGRCLHCRRVRGEVLSGGALCCRGVRGSVLSGGDGRRRRQLACGAGALGALPSPLARLPLCCPYSLHLPRCPLPPSTSPARLPCPPFHPLVCACVPARLPLPARVSRGDRALQRAQGVRRRQPSQPASQPSASCSGAARTRSWLSRGGAVCVCVPPPSRRPPFT